MKNRLMPKILVVEDNLINQIMIMRTLERFGYFAVAVVNGREALEALNEIRFDLILMDCAMPDMDGFETSLNIRIGTTRKSVPIVGMSGNVKEENRIRCRDVGMNDFIAKPINKEELSGLLTKWLGQLIPVAT